MTRPVWERISPVFIEWHDSGNSPHFYSSDTYGKRIVRHYELEYIICSRSGYIVTDGIPVLTVPHTVFFRVPDMMVEGIGVYRSLYMEFDLNMEGARASVFDAFPAVFSDVDFVDEALFQAFRLKKAPSCAELLLWKSDVLRLLSSLAKTAESGSRSGSFHDNPHLQKIKAALSYIQLHYAEEITEQMLADIAGYSAFYFCKLFKRVTNLTPMQYVVCCRIEKARRQLLFSDDTAESVMLQCGFRHYGYFCRTFRKINGLSPQAYRREYRAAGKCRKQET